MTPLPHNDEVEQQLLSACLKDEGQTYRRSVENGITPASFHDPRNSHLWDLYSQVPVPCVELLLPLVTEEHGGTPYLFQIDNKAATTAFASHFISQVYELASKRAVIRSAQALIEHAQNGTTLDELAADAASLVPRPALPDLSPRLFSSAQDIPKPPEIYTAAGTTICTPGNLTTIYSQAKAGKTALIGAMIAAAMDTSQASIHDTLGFRSSNPHGHALLHFDTEQSRYDWARMISTACKRVALPAPPPWLLSYNLTGLSASESRRFLQNAIRQAQRKFTHIHSIFLDGVADFVASPNDDQECFPFITSLHSTAIELDCPIISILHMNAGSENEKGRGHLGSQLERKSESNITMEKKDEITSYWGTRQRGKAIPKSQAPSFKWSDLAGYHVSCDQAPQAKGGRPKSFDLMNHLQVFPSDAKKAMSKNTLLRFVKEEVSVSDTAFRDALTDAVRNGVLVRTPSYSGAFVYHLAEGFAKAVDSSSTPSV